MIQAKRRITQAALEKEPPFILIAVSHLLQSVDCNVSCDRQSVGSFYKGKPNIPLELVSTDDEVYKSDYFRLMRSQFLFDPQLSNYYRQPNSKTTALYFLFMEEYSQKSSAIRTHHVFGI